MLEFDDEERGTEGAFDDEGTTPFGSPCGMSAAGVLSPLIAC